MGRQKHITVKLPKSVSLPGGFKIKVSEIPTDQIVGITGSPENQAAWVGETQHIYLASERDAVKKKWDFIHEFMHGVVDWLEFVGALGEPAQEVIDEIKAEFKQQVVKLLEARLEGVSTEAELVLNDVLDEVREL
jgi:hypothetical protein